jgi:hypothetical protein
VWKVLQVDNSGTPQHWINLEEAAKLFCEGDVAWSTGKILARLHGGWNKMGDRSFLDIPAVIGTHGRASIDLASCVPSLTNGKLFVRDRHVCAYCGEVFRSDALTRDHILPTSRGGKDIWMNVVSACLHCNGKKANKTPEEAKMPLLYVPYAPNWFEKFILEQGTRRILADQMDFLVPRLPANSRLRQELMV